MNDKLIQKVIAKAKSAGMPAGVKAAQRARVAEFVRANPVTNTNLGRLNHRSPISSHYFGLILKTRTMPIALIIALMIGGGTSAAASGSLPGDALYPVKVNVNERVEALLALSAEADAKVEAKLAARRLEEAEKLAGENRLSAEAKADLEARFAAHQARVQALVEKLSDNDLPAAVAAHADFEGSLVAHEAVLANIARREAAKNAKEAGEIAAKVRAALAVTANLRPLISVGATSTATTTAKVMPQKAAEGVIGAAENKIAAVERRVASEANAEVKAKATVALNASKADLASAKAKLAAGAYTEAFTLAGSAQRKAQEANAYINANGAVRSDSRTATSTNTTGGEVKGNADVKVDTGNSTGTPGVKTRGEVKIQLGL